MDAPARAAGERVRQALAFVAGFSAVFTLIGITATYLGQGLVDILPALRIIGGAALIVLGLNLAGILRIPALEQTWRPLDAGAAGSLATTTGSIALGSPAAPARPELRRSPRWPTRRHARRLARLARTRRDLRHRLDAMHRHHPRRDPDAGGHLRHGRPGHGPADRLLALVSGCPFVAIALAYDRAPGLLRPLVRHGRTVSLIGGLLVAGIGVAMVLDCCALLPRYFTFITAI